jgi:hypothetical protein
MSQGRTLRPVAGAVATITLGVALVLGGPWSFREAVGAEDAAQGGPSAVAGSRIASPGQLVNVSGAGWAPLGGVATIQICGQNARNLTADCDETNTYSAAIREGGTFSGALIVRLPKTPCPCAFFVTSVSGQSVKIPLQIAGAPVALIPPDTSAGVELTATISTPVSVWSWFGGPKPAKVELRLTNSTGVTLPTPVVSVTVGRGAHPTWLVAGRSLQPIPAGISRMVEIPITIPAVTFGHYTVRVQVATGSGNIATSAQTTSWPWGLLVLLIVVVDLILFAVAGMVRRARRRRDAALELSDEPMLVTPPAGTPVSVH